MLSLKSWIERPISSPICLKIQSSWFMDLSERWKLPIFVAGFLWLSLGAPAPWSWEESNICLKPLEVINFAGHITIFFGSTESQGQSPRFLDPSRFWVSPRSQIRFLGGGIPCNGVCWLEWSSSSSSLSSHKLPSGYVKIAMEHDNL